MNCIQSIAMLFQWISFHYYELFLPKIGENYYIISVDGGIDQPKFGSVLRIPKFDRRNFMSPILGGER